jgi:hypothetical protein
LIAYSPRAARQVDDLRQHYEDRDRFEAVTTRFAALAEVEDKIARGVRGRDGLGLRRGAIGLATGSAHA